MANTIGWGQGTINNTNGWGKGASNNSISWGSIYGNSPSGETNIIGGLQPTFELKYDLISTDFTFTRNSFATRVNEFGLIETVTNLGSDVVENGSFDELGSELVVNGDFENGDAGWTTEANWIISGGLLNGSNTLTETYRLDTSIVSGKSYLFEFDIKNYTSGTISPKLGGISGTAVSGIGTYREVIVAGSGGRKVSLDAVLPFTGSIDNVSVKQVDPNDDWNNEGVWTIGDGYASGNGATGSSEELGQNISASGILVGDTVKCSFELKNYASGSVQVIGISNPISRSANGIYEFQGDIISTNIRFRGSSFNGDVTNLIIQEVIKDDIPRIDYTGSTFDVPVLGDELVTNGSFDTDTDWTLNSGWSIGDGVASCDGTSGSSIYQNTGGVLDTVYKIELTISNYVSGTLQIGGSSRNLEASSNGIFTHYRTWTSDSTLYLKSKSGDGFNGSIDNVSVKEVTAYTTTDTGAFLLEPQSTNLITYSEDVSGASNWTSTGLTRTIDSTTSLDGTQNADLIESTDTSSCILKDNTLTFTVGNTYTFSVFAKKGNNDWIRTGHVSSGATGCWFDLENGVVGTVNSESATIEDYGNGWYRCTNTFVATQATSATQIFIGICDADGSVNAGVIGQNNYVWGMQVEALITYATSYIPTSGTTVTRAQESCVNATVSANSEEGVLYAEISALSNDLTNRYITISDGSNSNYIRLAYNTSSNTIEARYYNGGTFQCALTASISDETDVKKVAFKWKQDDFSVWVDGVEMDSDNSGNVITPNVFDDLTFSRPDGSVFPFYGRTKDLKIYDKALTDDELTELTTI